MEKNNKKKIASKKLEIYNAKLTEDDDFDEDDDYFDPYDKTDSGGVVYSSTKTSSTSAAPNEGVPSRRKPSPITTTKKKKKKKANYTVFVIATVTTGIAVTILALIVIFAVVGSSIPWGKNTQSSSGDSLLSGNSNNNSPSVNAIPDEAQQNDTGIIKRINESSISLYIFSSGKTENFTVNNLTEIKDKYGKGITFIELSEGDIVDVTYLQSQEALKLIQANSQVWVSRFITNVTADVENKTIAIGNKIYKYTNEMMFLNGDKLSSLSKLSATDVVTVSGYKDELWTIFVEKTQAYIQVIPNPKIINGILEVDTNVYMRLSEEEYEKINVSEGLRRIVVKGDNIEVFTEEVQIDAGETYELDLSQVQIKRCALIVNVNTTGYSLYVNNVLQDVSSEPLVLEYGTYDIRVEKEDYFPYSNTFNVRQESATLNVTLSEVPKQCSATIETIPSGADIYLNNIYLGISPLTAMIPFGEHRITARKVGYYEISTPQTISLEEEKFLINLDKVPEVTEVDPPVQNTTPSNDEEDETIDSIGSVLDEDIVIPSWFNNEN